MRNLWLYRDRHVIHPFTEPIVPFFHWFLYYYFSFSMFVCISFNKFWFPIFKRKLITVNPNLSDDKETVCRGAWAALHVSS